MGRQRIRVFGPSSLTVSMNLLKIPLCLCASVPSFAQCSEEKRMGKADWMLPQRPYSSESLYFPGISRVEGDLFFLQQKLSVKFLGN